MSLPAAVISEPETDVQLVEKSDHRRHRWVTGSVLVLTATFVVYGVLGWLASERSIDAERIRIAAVTRGPLVRDAVAPGRVVAASSPTLYAPAEGIVRYKVEAGKALTAGDVVAVLESPVLRSRLRREETVLVELRAELGSTRMAADAERLAARREVDEAIIALNSARREHRRAEWGFNAGVIPEIELMQAKDSLSSAEVRKRNAVASRTLADKSATFSEKTKAAQHRRQQLVVEDLERQVMELRVCAPVTGVVGSLSTTERARVLEGSPLMTVVDLSELEVELEVPEGYAADLKVGMAVNIEAAGDEVTGHLSSLSPEVVERAVGARVRFEEQPVGFRQSQRVSARILIEERPDVVIVPRGPFLNHHGGRYIFVIRDRIAVRRNIRVGISSVGKVEVISGLEPGEKVIIAGSDAFGDATSIQINE